MCLKPSSIPPDEVIRKLGTEDAKEKLLYKLKFHSLEVLYKTALTVNFLQFAQHKNASTYVLCNVNLPVPDNYAYKLHGGM